MYEQPTHIDLTLPRSWNQCSTEQLELIAAAILHHTQRQDRYHPFDWLAVKTELFFLFTGLEVTGEVSDPVDDDPEYQHRAFLVRRARQGQRLSFRRQGGGEPTFPIYIWQVQSFIEQHLAWIDDPKAAPLLIFPYKHLLWEWRFQLRPPFLKKHYLAPGELLQDFSWQQYRHLQDYMEMYVRLQNQIAKIQQGPANRDTLAALAGQMLDARRHFLAILFKAEGKAAANSSKATGRRDSGNLFTLHSSLKKITDIRWQVILFWWSGLMHYLQRQYPHCFKQSKKKAPSRQPNPLELYTSIVATMQTQAHLSEDDINGQTFHIVLEQLERLAKQNEEMEKLSKKH